MLRRKTAGLASVFGSLEMRVLEALWTRGAEASVRDILDEFPNAAYTTLMTTMERLHRKGVLERRKDGRAFLYWPVSSRDEMETGLVARALEPLPRRRSAQPTLSGLVGGGSPH